MEHRIALLLPKTEQFQAAKLVAYVEEVRLRLGSPADRCGGSPLWDDDGARRFRPSCGPSC
jgi:hypothetical protein